MAEHTSNGYARAERVVTIAALSFGMIAGIWGFAIRPIESRVGTLEVRSEKREDQLEQTQHNIIAIQEKLTEIETQFRQLSHINNIHFAESHKFTQLLWHRVYGDRLPDMTYFPEVGK